MFGWLRDRLAGVFGSPRSPRWPEVRAAHLALHPACEACGRIKSLAVHHCKPYHESPEIELSPSNLLTLCTDGPGINCHFAIGHGGNWSAHNPNVREDVARHRETLRHRINPDYRP